MSLGPNDRSIPLNPLQERTLHRMWMEEPVIRGCANRIIQALFNGGIHVTEGDGANDADNMANLDFQDYLQEYWRPFGAEVIVNFMLFGFCPYVINRKQLSKRPVRWVEYPVVPPWGTYQVHVQVNSNYEREYKVFPRNLQHKPRPSHKPDKRVNLVFFGNNTLPDIYGNYTTDTVSLTNAVANCDEHEEYALRAESLRTHPTLFVQSQQDSRKYEQVTHMRAFDGDEMEEAVIDTKRQKLNNNYRGMSDTAHMAGGTDTQAPAYSSRTGRMFPRHSKLWENSIFAVPDGMEFASNVPKPEARADIVDIVRHKEELICATIGVPRTVLFSDFAGQGGEAQTESQSETFRRTVDCYRAATLRMLNQVYSEIFIDNKGERMHLPGKAISALSDILTVYDRGIINGDTMARYCQRSLGVSVNDVDKKRVGTFDKHHVKTILANPVPQELSRATVDTSDDKIKNPSGPKKKKN